MWNHALVGFSRLQRWPSKWRPSGIISRSAFESLSDLICSHKSPFSGGTLGFEAIAAEDALAGVAAFQEYHPCVCAVLLDLKMSKMGGRKASLESPKLIPGVPVIVCTG